MLDDTGLPDLFVGLEPLPAPPVTLPDDPLVQQLASVALPSTVKISAATCLSISSGTGFAVDRRVRRHERPRRRRREHGPGRPSATSCTTRPGPVRSRPRRRPAVRAAARRPAAARSRRRIRTGARPGRRSASRAAAASTSSRRRSRARTRRRAATSTATTRVSRPILELRADIDQGDSGGPLVLADGTVGGVVFAEARTDEDVGYALTPTAVERGDRAGDRSDRRRFRSGTCIH